MWKEVGSTRTYFLYADEGLIGEYDSTGAEIKTYGYASGSTWTADPIFMKEDGNYYFYQNDHLGTSQKMAGVNGAIVWEAKYEAFGKANVEVTTVENNLRFPGQYFDEESGLHYNYHRYYDPGTGRYLRPDPSLTTCHNSSILILSHFQFGNPQGVNRFAYVKNNSVNLIDPLGLFLGLPSLADKAAAERVQRAHPELWKGKNAYFAHCALACQIAKENGPWAAHNAALWKEVIDKYDCDPDTHYEKEDFEAALEGIKIGLESTGNIDDSSDCIEGCKRKGYVP